MVQDLKSKSPGLNILAREAGLLLAAAHYQPLQGIHIPGVSNVVADKLSRAFAPPKPGAPPWQLPTALNVVVRREPPCRAENWYRTMKGPAAPSPACGG